MECIHICALFSTFPSLPQIFDHKSVCTHRLLEEWDQLLLSCYRVAIHLKKNERRIILHLNIRCDLSPEVEIKMAKVRNLENIHFQSSISVFMLHYITGLLSREVTCRHGQSCLLPLISLWSTFNFQKERAGESPLFLKEKHPDCLQQLVSASLSVITRQQ